MRLKRILNLPKTIGYRVAAWYSCIFVLSSLLFFLIIYFFLSSILKRQDSEEILQEMNEIVSVYEYGGVIALEYFIMDNHTFRRTQPLFVRILTENNKTKYIFSEEQWRDFDLLKLESIVPDINGSWIYLSATDGDYELNILTACLHRGFLVQVGKSSERRDKVLNQFYKIFLMVMIPLFMIGLTGGMFLSYQTLAPIRHIIQTVKSLDVLAIHAKVPRSHTRDELDELAVLFNKMLANIHLLVQGMKNSLDNVAHDLRTPMTRMRNAAESALRVDAGTEVLKEALEKSLEESERILGMLNTLMDISEAENGVMTIEKDDVDLSELVLNVADMYQYVAEEKGVGFYETVPPGLKLRIDAGRMSQALANILDNAVKFTPPGGRIEIRVENVDDKAVIIVRDTGIGISDNEIPRIWDRLYRGDQSRTEKGLGLGLSLVKGIVNAHQGHLEVTSKPGNGTEFKIILFLENPQII